MSESTINAIKIYGERNAGTNYLERVLRLNFQQKLMSGSQPLKTEMLEELTAKVPKRSRRIAWEMALDVSMAEIRNSAFGWKHGVPPWDAIEQNAERRSATLFIVLSKHPADWLRSMYRKPYHCLFPHANMDMKNFLHHPWITMSKDGINLQDNIIQLWNNKHRAWLQLRGRAEHVVYVRYTDILTDFDGCMTQFASHLGAPQYDVFRNIEKSAKGVPVSRADYVEQYSNADIFREFDSEDVDFILSELDHACAAELGYEQIRS